MEDLIYFRDYARALGCPVDELGDKAVWNFILIHEGEEPLT